MSQLMILALWLSDSKTLAFIGIAELLFTLTFVFFDVHLHSEWEEKQQISKNLVRSTMLIWAAGFFLVMLSLVCLITDVVVRGSPSTQNIRIFSIIFASVTAVAFVYLLSNTRKFIKSHGADSKPWM